MNLRGVQREHKDPYIHNVAQEEMYSHGVGQETPGHSTQLVTQGKKVYTLTYTIAGVWQLDKNDGSAATVLAGDYEPDFRVRYLKVWGQNKQDFDYENMCVVYDTPQSEGVTDYWRVGIMHKIWITKLHLTDRSTTTCIITLIG